MEDEQLDDGIDDTLVSLDGLRAAEEASTVTGVIDAGRYRQRLQIRSARLGLRNTYAMVSINTIVQ
ncbi:MAG: hypothetical protein WCF22_19490 [Candidatus Sulfotelmatobacter sp.]